jgi:hypothetical protein
MGCENTTEYLIAIIFKQWTNICSGNMRKGLPRDTKISFGTVQ